MLLMSRALNPSNPDLVKRKEFQEFSGTLSSQRKLAEIMEMITAAYSIHKSVLNLPTEMPPDICLETKDSLIQLEYGNKIAILGQSY